MYVQCKTYVKLFRRWKQFNRVIYINDIQLAEEGGNVEGLTVSVIMAPEPPHDNDNTVTIRINDQPPPDSL